MAAEKFFGGKDPLVMEVGGSLARQSSAANNEEISQKIQKVLDDKKGSAKATELSTEYDLSSTQHPNQIATLELILSDSAKYIPYLAAQLKDLFTADYAAAAQKDGNHI